MSTLLFRFFLTFFILLQTNILANKILEERQEVTTEPIVAPDDTSEESSISEAQREADAAEAAELQEAGEGEEPPTE